MTCPKIKMPAVYKKKPFKKPVKVTIKKQVQWFRPGERRIQTYTRKGSKYTITGNRKYKKSPRVVMVPVVDRRGSVVAVTPLPSASSASSVSSFLSEYDIDEISQGSIDLRSGLRPFRKLTNGKRLRI